jgi:hypothetical protein
VSARLSSELRATPHICLTCTPLSLVAHLSPTHILTRRRTLATQQGSRFATGTHCSTSGLHPHWGAHLVGGRVLRRQKSQSDWVEPVTWRALTNRRSFGVSMRAGVFMEVFRAAGVSLAFFTSHHFAQLSTTSRPSVMGSTW